jgi:hypothetical protein
MKTAFDPSLPIKTLFDQIKDSVDLAAAADAPYTPKQVVAIAYNIAFQTGMFTEGCRDWCKQVDANKTWQNFKTNFATAHQDLCKLQLTLQTAGYHSANNAFHDRYSTITMLANLVLL